jgi:hypothetical protein
VLAAAAVTTPTPTKKRVFTPRAASTRSSQVKALPLNSVPTNVGIVAAVAVAARRSVAVVVPPSEVAVTPDDEVLVVAAAVEVSAVAVASRALSTLADRAMAGTLVKNLAQCPFPMVPKAAGVS